MAKIFVSCLAFGAWESISKMRFREVKKMQVWIHLRASFLVWSNRLIRYSKVEYCLQVWDACADSLITFGKGYSATEESLAYIVENDVILDAIVRSLDTMKSVVRVAYNAKVKSYTLPSPSNSNALPRLDLADGRSIETKLLVRVVRILFLPHFACYNDNFFALRTFFLTLKKYVNRWV